MMSLKQRKNSRRYVRLMLFSAEKKSPQKLRTPDTGHILAIPGLMMWLVHGAACRMRSTTTCIGEK
jgi:hypothetical protein